MQYKESIMANNDSSNVVAIVAIIIIVLIAAVALYYFFSAPRATTPVPMTSPATPETNIQVETPKVSLPDVESPTKNGGGGQGGAQGGGSQ